MTYTTKPTLLFWGVAVACLLWNALGCFMYYLDVSLSYEAYVETYGQAMADVREAYPIWSVSAYAIAVWGGLVAAITLLLRKSVAVPLFIISLIAAFISFTYGFTNEAARAAAGPSGIVMPIIVLLIGVFEVFYARRAKSKGIIG